MSKIDDIKNKYLIEPHKALRIYIGIAFFDLLIFGFLGLHLSLAAYSEKKSKLKSVQAEVTKVTQKREFLNSVDDDIKAVSPYLASLTEAIPDNPDMQNYLMQLVTACAKEGFVVEDLRTNDTNDKFVEGIANLTVSLSGLSTNFPALTNSLENLTRTTVITDSSMVFEEGLYKINMNLKVYYSDNKTLDLTLQPNAKIDKEFLSKEFKPAQ